MRQLINASGTSDWLVLEGSLAGESISMDGQAVEAGWQGGWGVGDDGWLHWLGSLEAVLVFSWESYSV